MSFGRIVTPSLLVPPVLRHLLRPERIPTPGRHRVQYPSVALVEPRTLSRPLSTMSAPAGADARGVNAAGELPDIIQIKQLTVRMIVGVDNWERVSPQTVTIDAKVHTDVSKAGKSDHLPYSIHYGILVKQLEAHCANNRYRSLEALAEGLAKICIFVCHAPRVTLNVEKPRSLLHAASAGVQIVRTAKDFEDAQGRPATELVDVPAEQLSNLRLSPRSRWAVEDKVIVRDLIINAILGVNPWEREDKQDIKLNLTIHSGLERLRQAGQKQSGIVDVVSKPHNYRTIVRSITEYVEQSSYKTVESLATSIARVAVLHNNVERIRVSVDKPSAIMFAASAGVEVDRDRAFFEEEAKQEAAEMSARSQSAVPQESSAKPSLRLPSDGQWHIAAIALGSNVGDRASNLENAVQLLSDAEGCVLVDTSFLYETAPMYVTDQPRFLNGACRVATTLSPHDLLKLTQSIETKLGRDKTGVPDKGPRSVDLDILLYDNLELEDGPRLVIPHPAIKEREFVLEPLKDILPEFEHPKHSRTIAQLLTMLQKSPDYMPSGIKRVLPMPTYAGRAEAPADTPLWTWGPKTFVMGIINATPDSFSDGGDNQTVDAAVKTALQMVEEGADILDVGGMSTAPGAPDIAPEEETARVVPVIRAIRSAGITVPISIDTFRASVAEAALEAGANIINDVSGGEHDSRILDVARKFAVPFILMHMRGDSKTMTRLTRYEGDDVLEGVKEELSQRLEAALRHGVRRWNIILDPGIGFAKDQKGNVDLIRRLSELTTRERSRYASRAPSRPMSPSMVEHANSADGEYDLATRPLSSLAQFPVLLGPSRKRFLGTITGRTDPKERVYATAAACAAGIASGVDILRVHDVKEMVDVSRTCDAIYRA